MRALELDPECGEAYCSLAMFQLALKHEWDLAESSFRRAIRQNPSYSMGLNWLSIACLVPLSRFDEATHPRYIPGRHQQLRFICFQGLGR